MNAMCEKPGCVGVASHGRYCAVHASPLGVPCETCRGTGYVSRGERLAWAVCDRCGGCGLRDTWAGRRTGGQPADIVDARGLIREMSSGLMLSTGGTP